ncbi:quinone oxidoreductase PIG3-like isoform X2 [Branchiostoma floridae x Branchiostoma japonicum]
MFGVVRTHSRQPQPGLSHVLFGVLLSRLCTKTEAMSDMQAVVLQQPGGPDNLSVGRVAKPRPQAGEVLLKVYATAVNRADTLQRKGLYPPPKGASDILGLEAAGKVDDLGPDCKGRWKHGERVMALLPGGGNAEFVTVDEDHLMAIPAGMSYQEAAAIPEVWLTAYQLLHFVGGLQEGETVLIHAGGSGVGTAATQLSRLAGARPIITAGTPEKLQRATDLGAVAAFNYKEGEFAQKVLDETNGKGVDVILDCVGASFWQQNVRCLALEGRWVLYGLLGGGSIDGDILSQVLRKRINLLGTTLRARSKQYKASLVKSFSERALPHFTSGGLIHLRPIIDRVVPLQDISKAHSCMEDNKNTGKIVLSVRDEDRNEL